MNEDIRVGSISIERLTELQEWRLPARSIFPHLTEAQLGDEAVKWGPESIDLGTGDLLMSITCYLVKLPNGNLLVDTGNGNGRHRPMLTTHHMFDTDFHSKLTGVEGGTDGVRWVVSTHLHPDHVGWNTFDDNGTWAPTFPKATYLFDTLDVEHFRRICDAPRPGTMEEDFALSYADSIQPIMDARLDAVIEPPHVFYEDGDTRVWAEPWRGHTPGHLVVMIDSDGERGIISGDIIHHPFQISDLALIQDGDVDTTQAAAARVSMVEECIRTDALLMPAHFPPPYVGRFTSEEGVIGFSYA